MHAHRAGWWERRGGHWKCIRNCHRAWATPEAASSGACKWGHVLSGYAWDCTSILVHLTHDEQERVKWRVKRECPATFWPGRKPLTTYLLPLTTYPSVCLIHLRIGVANCMEIKLKRAKDFPAFPTPHGHFVQFANKYWTLFPPILWTNVKENIFTTATYRQLMKTTPNWFTICCHQLTCRFSRLPVFSFSGGRLLFEPAKHIKLTLALPLYLLAGIFISFSVQQLRLNV